MQKRRFCGNDLSQPRFYLPFSSPRAYASEIIEFRRSTLWISFGESQNYTSRETWIHRPGFLNFCPEIVEILVKDIGFFDGTELFSWRIFGKNELFFFLIDVGNSLPWRKYIVQWIVGRIKFFGENWRILDKLLFNGECSRFLWKRRNNSRSWIFKFVFWKNCCKIHERFHSSMELDSSVRSTVGFLEKVSCFFNGDSFPFNWRESQLSRKMYVNIYQCGFFFQIFCRLPKNWWSMLDSPARSVEEFLEKVTYFLTENVENSSSES